MKPARLLRWLKRAAIGVVALVLLIVIAVAIAWHLFPFPEEKLDDWPISPLVTDRTGGVILQIVGKDDQWRRPIPLEEMGSWLPAATIAVEDERYRSHAGVDALAVLRAAGQNLREGSVVSGASTITMQVCRMMDDRPRTMRSKVVEAFRALQLEECRDKATILELYLNMAPYGGNIRGAEAASIIYFGKHARDLSLAEASLLAGLPKSPTALRPNQYPDAAMKRRRTVLRRMYEQGVVTAAQRDDANAEPVVLVDHPRAPGLAPHAAWLALQRRRDGGVTTIDRAIQRQVRELAEEHAAELADGLDLAIVVIEIVTGDVVALIGSADPDDPIDGQVNGATALRSPGSALKPFVYAAAFEAERLAPDSMVPDVPIERSGWSPKNFDQTFRGEVEAGEALRQSLNIPPILIAESLGLARCTSLMRAAGVELPHDAEFRAGLSIVTGGVEVTLLDLVNAYATLGRGGIRCAPRLFADDPLESTRVMRAPTCAVLDDVLGSHRRRPRGLETIAPENAPWFMWKTGTSSHQRDAWAVGHNGEYAAGVWVGDFAGGGHPSILGSQIAEPLLTRLFAETSLRSDAAPTPPPPGLVRRPLVFATGASESVAITSPTDRGQYMARDGRATIRLQASAADAHWFLNGRILATTERDRLELAPGQYELRCVRSDGRASAVQFTIRSPRR